MRLDVRKLEPREHALAVVIWIVVVPLVAVGVVKDHDFREGWIVVYDVTYIDALELMRAREEQIAYVKYVIPSRPLFAGTVRSAFWSSWT